MGRTSKISDSKVFAAVGERVARGGAVTLQDVVADTGVSIGSIYHRYQSREELLARAWLDAVSVFQAEFLAELNSDLEDSGERAAMATPRFCRRDPKRARILVCCRREELVHENETPVTNLKLESANAEVAQSVRQFAKERGYTLDACLMGLVGFPLGAVRMYLPDRKVPFSVDGYVATAFRSVVGQQ